MDGSRVLRVPDEWSGKDLLIRAWMRPDEAAPTWDGKKTKERAPDRTVPYQSEQTLTVRGEWDWAEFCLLREFVIAGVKPGTHEIALAHGARGEVSVGTLPTEFMMCGRAISSRRKQSLDGEWKFALVKPEAAGACKPRRAIKVPAHWELEGFSKPTYGSWKDGARSTGVYVRRFDRPRGQRVHLVIEAAQNRSHVWVNGAKAGEHESGFTPFEMDVTDLVNPGENKLRVQVDKYSRTAFFEDAGEPGYFYLAGIFRSVYLYTTPEVWLSGFRYDVSYTGKDARVTVTAEVSAVACEGGAYAVRAVLGDAVAERQVVVAEATDGWSAKGLVKLELKVRDVKKWTAETPHLYPLRLELLQGGKRVDEVRDEIGLRVLSIEGQLFKVSGVSVKLRGVCRHDFSPTTGNATDEKLWKRDLELMRQGGVNAVRCSHYPPCEGFLRLCDKLGFYVIHEASAMWVKEEADEFYPAYWLRAHETQRRDMNRASVILWGLGNEHKDTINFRRSALYCRRNDTRPVIYAGSSVDDADLVTPHYVMKGITKSLSDGRPVICTEDFTTSRGWWPNDAISFTDEFASYWDEVIWPEPRINGVFLWEWPERMVVWKDRIFLSNLYKYGVAMYESQAGPWRTDKLPWFNLLRDVYAPVRVILRGNEVDVRNQLDFTPLSDATLRWSFGGLASGSAQFALRPHGAKTFRLKLPEAPDGALLTVEVVAGGKTVARRTEWFAATANPLPTKVVPSEVVPDNWGYVVDVPGATYKIHDGSIMLFKRGRRVRGKSLLGMYPSLALTPPGNALGGFLDRDKIVWDEFPGKTNWWLEGETIVHQCVTRAARLEMRYTVVPEGLHAHYWLMAKSKRPVPAVGIRMWLTHTKRWGWRGLGPYSTYPDLELAAEHGEYEAPIVTKYRAGRTIPMADEEHVGEWEEKGGNKSRVDWCRFDNGVEMRFFPAVNVECERILPNGVEVRINSLVGKCGNELIDISQGVTVEGEILLSLK